MKKSGGVLILSAGAAGLGIVIGAISAAFLYLIDWGQHAVWESGWIQFKYAPLLICSLGGILIGFCQRYLGDHPKNLHGAVEEIRKTGRLEYAHLPNGLISAFISLIFGASLGPGAAVVNLLGGLSTWASDKLKKLSSWLRIPESTPDRTLVHRLARRWPNVLAISIAVVIFIIGIKDLYGGGVLKLNEPFAWIDLLWSIPMALLGATGGALFLGLGRWMKQRLRFLKQKPVLRGVLSGCVLGLIACFLPMMLFSGQFYLQQVYEQAAILGFWMLLWIALARLFLINLLLESGWKGGQFFPLMFASVAFGLSIKNLFPFVPDSAAIFGTMAAMITIVLPKPIVVLIVMAIFFPPQYLGISAVGVGVVMFGDWLWKRIKERVVNKTNRFTNHSLVD